MIDIEFRGGQADLKLVLKENDMTVTPKQRFTSRQLAGHTIRVTLWDKYGVHGSVNEDMMLSALSRAGLMIVKANETEDK